MTGFEPAASRTQTERSSKLNYIPLLTLHSICNTCCASYVLIYNPDSGIRTRMSAAWPPLVFTLLNYIQSQTVGLKPTFFGISTQWHYGSGVASVRSSQLDDV